MLDGALGAGKTTFTQGIARGVGIEDAVTSPTFVLAREMHLQEPASETAVSSLTHVDAYRLSGVDEWDDLDIDVHNTVSVIEWGSRVSAALPIDHLSIHLAVNNDDANLVDDLDAGDRRTIVASAHGDASRQLLAAFVASVDVDEKP